MERRGFWGALASLIGAVTSACWSRGDHAVKYRIDGDLQPVGVDPDGSIRPADQLSYPPLGTPEDFGHPGGLVYGNPDDAKARLLGHLMASGWLGWDFSKEDCREYCPTSGDGYDRYPGDGAHLKGQMSVPKGHRRYGEDAALSEIAYTIRRYRHFGIYFLVEFVGFCVRDLGFCNGHDNEDVVCRFRVVRIDEGFLVDRNQRGEGGLP